MVTYFCIFVDDNSGFKWIYGLARKQQMLDVAELFYADTAPLREKHGHILWFRRDNAAENVSEKLEEFLLKEQVRSETSNPYESWQNGSAERSIQTVLVDARTLMNASGLVGQWWYHACQHAVHNRNMLYSPTIKTSPWILMLGQKPDLNDFQMFGVECWLYKREEQRKDKKFSSVGERCIYLGSAQNRKGHVLWCVERGPKALTTSTNVTFGNRCPCSKRSPVEYDLGTDIPLPLPSPPAPLSEQDLHSSVDAHIVGVFQNQYVIEGSTLKGQRLLSPDRLLDIFAYTHDHNLNAVHLSLADSFEYFCYDFPTANLSSIETHSSRDVPRTVEEAMSPKFAPEFIPAMDAEIGGFLHHTCFGIFPKTSNSPKTLPGFWIFSRKRDGTAKARFVIGGHRQRLGKDYFQYKNYASVLSSRDNRVLLALAAAEGWHVFATDIVQAFLYGVLDDVDLYIDPPARYPCPPGSVLKLKKAIYGLHQAPVKFKKEVTDWFLSNGYSPANPAKTIWIKRTKEGLIIHAQYADDFLHFTDNLQLYYRFRERFSERFSLKSGIADVYLGNKIEVDQEKEEVRFNQTVFVEELLEQMDMSKANATTTPMVERLSATESVGEKLSAEQHGLYRSVVGSLLYLACWTRPDIAFAVSELSRFMSAPCVKHFEALKRLLRYLKGTVTYGLRYTRASTDRKEKSNVLWGFVDSDWAGCPDSRRSTSGYVLMLNGAAVAWKSKKQSVVALSSAEAEFISASSMVQEVIYIRRLLESLGFKQDSPTKVFEDNRTCIAWSEGSVGGSDRAKHIDLREHYVHEAVEQKHLELIAINSVDNAADMLTKPVSHDSLIRLRKTIMGL